MKNLNYNNKEVTKPWGYYNVVKITNRHKKKLITIFPNKRISLQKHTKRSELWKIEQGSAKVKLNNKIIYMNENDEIFIPKNTIHRVKNIGTNNLIIKEIQIGEYLEEDDIIRIEDDYGRI